MDGILRLGSVIHHVLRLLAGLLLLVGRSLVVGVKGLLLWWLILRWCAILELLLLLLLRLLGRIAGRVTISRGVHGLGGQ